MPFRIKGREGTEDTMLSTLQRQLESGVDAPAAHRDLVKHVVQAVHEAVEKKPMWKCVAWHCWLSVIAQTYSTWGKKPPGELEALGQVWGDPQQRNVLGGRL